MRVVLDTDVVVAAFRSPSGASAELLRRARLGQVEIAASVALLIEYEAALTRPMHLDAAGATAVEACAFVDALAAMASAVDVRYLWRGLLPDPSDAMVLEAAFAAKAAIIATFNERDFVGRPAWFGIEVKRPALILEALR